MKNKSINTKSVIEAGIISALIVVAAILSNYIVFFQFMGIVVIPLLISMLYIRHNFKVTILSVVVCFILIFTLFSFVPAFGFLLSNVLPGIALGYCVKNKKSSLFTLIFVAVTYLIVISISVFIITKLTYEGGITSIINEFVTTSNNMFNQIIEQYKSMGISSDKIDIIRKSRDAITTKLIFIMLPGCLVITSLIFSFINYKVAFIILKRIGIKINEIKEFNKWHLDDRITGIIIGAISIGIIMTTKNISGGEIVLYTALNVGKFIFTIFGISFVTFILNTKYKISNSVIFLIVLVSLMFGAHIIYFAIGIIDSISNLRKIKENFRGNIK